MTIELLEPRDHGKRIVPYTTSAGVQIGSRYTPPRDAGYASCGERHASRGYGVAWWVAMSAVAVLSFVVIAGVRYE
jgi:hypothetical protein